MLRGVHVDEDVITTVLDVLAVLLVAFGLAAAAFPVIGWAAAAVAGVVLLAAVRVADALARRRAVRGG